MRLYKLNYGTEVRELDIKALAAKEPSSQSDSFGPKLPNSDTKNAINLREMDVETPQDDIEIRFNTENLDGTEQKS